MLHRFHRCYIDFYNPALPLRWCATRCVSRPKFWAEELVKSHTSSWNPCALLKSLHHPWAHLWAVLRAQCWSFPKWERGSVWAVASPQWLIWQHTLPPGWFHSIQRWHNTHKPRALFSKCCCLLLSGWESSLVPLSWWHLGGRWRARAWGSILWGYFWFGGLRKGIFAGSVAVCMAWGLFVSYGCSAPSDEATLWRGAAITAPQCDGFVTQGPAAPGGVCLSAEICLQFPWQEQWVTCIPLGAISMFSLFSRLLWHFPSPVVGASGLIICSRCQQG